MNLRTRIANMLEGVVIALDAIRSNKVRAGLTILGIAVGVFVVTVMSAAVRVVTPWSSWRTRCLGQAPPDVLLFRRTSGPRTSPSKAL